MVYVFLADGFEEIEALGTVDILRRCDISVQTVSITDHMTVKGAHGISVNTDILFEKLREEEAEALVLPGGLPGADNLENCKKLTTLLKAKAGEGVLISAICAAPKILGLLGLLSGVKATCYPGFEAKLIGARVKHKGVVSDGNFITAKGAGVTQEFAQAIADKLGKGAACRRVIKNMYY